MPAPTRASGRTRAPSAKAVAVAADVARARGLGDVLALQGYIARRRGTGPGPEPADDDASDDGQKWRDESASVVSEDSAAASVVRRETEVGAQRRRRARGRSR